ncbi:hypothetical protein GQ600_26875 [Phytophthora cactorum]|nr:hypothetical protein GQ600_26875 [Phytophthora cactorum]
MVAFSPSRESWMKDKFYKKVGTAYIVGRVCCTVKSKKKVEKVKMNQPKSQKKQHLSFSRCDGSIRNFNLSRKIFLSA